MAYTGKWSRRGAGAVNSGLDAFEKAYGLTKGVMDDYNRRAADTEAASLGEDARAVSGTGLTLTDAQGNVSKTVIDPSSGGDLDAIRRQYEDAGYKVDFSDGKYAARSGEGKDYGVYDTEREAEVDSRKATYGLMRQRAGVYQQHGLNSEAKGLRAEARQGERQDMQDRMAAETHDQQMQLGKLQVGEAQAKEQSRLRMDGFNKEFAALEAAGEIKTIGDIRKLAAKHQLSQPEVFQLATAKVGLDEAQTKAEAMARIRAFNDAYQRGGLKGVNELYDNDPMFANGRNMDVVPTKGGVKVLDGGREIFSGTEQEAMGFLHEHLADPIKAVSFAMEVKRFQMGQRKDEAAIRASDANAAESNAKAGLARRTDPNAGKGGTGTEKLTALTGYANSLNAQVANLDRALANVDPASPEAKAYKTQRDEAFLRLRGVRQQIEGDRLGLAGPGGVAPEVPDTYTDPSDGKTYRRVGDDPADPASWEEVAASAPARKGSPAPSTEAPDLDVTRDEQEEWRKRAMGSMGISPRPKPQVSAYRKLDPRGGR